MTLPVFLASEEFEIRESVVCLVVVLVVDLVTLRDRAVSGFPDLDVFS